MVSVFGKFNFVDKLSKFAEQKKGEEIKQVSKFTELVRIRTSESQQ